MMRWHGRAVLECTGALCACLFLLFVFSRICDMIYEDWKKVGIMYQDDGVGRLDAED